MATAMNGGDEALAKIQIAGPTLASLLQLVTTSPGDISGLLFGHVSDTTISITNTLLLPDTHTILNSSESNIIGWFSGRRLTPLRPSLRESMTSSALFKKQSPLIFLLITSPPPDANSSLIHTLEYRVYQYMTQAPKFRPKSLSITNLGPSTSDIYHCFVPNSPFPGLASASRGSTVRLQDLIDNADSDKQVLEGMGADAGKLSRLVGPDAANHTKDLEETVEEMLEKVKELTIQVHQTDPRLHNQLKSKKGEGGSSGKDAVEDSGEAGKGEGIGSKKNKLETKKMVVVNPAREKEKVVRSSLLPTTRGKEREARLPLVAQC